jgi:hypothetical protein
VPDIVYSPFRNGVIFTEAVIQITAKRCFVSLLPGRLLLFFRWADDQVAFLDQPVVELISGVNTAVLADTTDLIVLLGICRCGLEQYLDRAGEVIAVFPPLVVDVTF